ncbi:MAG: hypothetical protein ACMXYE_01475 [Candidatus Woesearchaeota archaeon]
MHLFKTTHISDAVWYLERDDFKEALKILEEHTQALNQSAHRDFRKLGEYAHAYGKALEKAKESLQKTEYNPEQELVRMEKAEVTNMQRRCKESAQKHLTEVQDNLRKMKRTSRKIIDELS